MTIVLHNLMIAAILHDLAELSFLLAPLSLIATTIVGLGIWRYQLIAARRYNVVKQALTAADRTVSDRHHIRRARSDADAFAAVNPDSLTNIPWHGSQIRIEGNMSSDTLQILPPNGTGCRAPSRAIGCKTS